mgnify:CR=1 FL=1
MRIGILVFPDAEELDFVGPYEVFTMSNEVFSLHGKPEPDNVMLISQTGGTVRCRKGMRVETDHAIADAPALDVLLVPGGQGTRAEAENRVLLDWIAEVDAGTAWTTSVCTGALLLAAAGVATGKRVTTHWAFVDQLRAGGEVAEVLENIRYVRDGKLVTAAGVSAGIDMALWLVGQMHGPEHARMTQRAMEYDPAPPYAAAV